MSETYLTVSGVRAEPTGRRPGTGSRTVLLAGLALLPALAYLWFVISNFGRIIDLIHLNPDAGWAPVLVADLANGTKGGSILVGEASHLGAIALLALTRSLPFRDALWDATPYLIYLAGMTLAAWACYRVAGRWAGLATFALGVSATSPVLLTVMAQGIRGNTFFADAFLAAALVWLASRPQHLRPANVSAWAGIIALAGFTLASDPLFLAVGLGPFVAAPALVWLADRGRASARLALIAAGSAILAALVSALVWQGARSMGFRKNYLTGGYLFASPGQMGINVGRFFNHLLVLGNGYFAGDAPAVIKGARAVMALLMAAAAGHAILRALRLMRSARGTRESSPLLLYCGYWLLSLAGTFAAFALSSFPGGPSDSSRYVIPAFLALAALAPLGGWNGGERRLATAAGVALFGVLSLVGRQEIFIYQRIAGFNNLLEQGPGIIAFLEAQGATKGYGGYFTSHPLTMMADMKVQFFPVIACLQPVSDRICPFSVNTRTAWYRPAAGIRSFVVQDRSAPPVIAPGPPAALGAPAATRQFGPISVYVYDYDVASTFAPPCLGSKTFFCPEKAAGGAGRAKTSEALRPRRSPEPILRSGPPGLENRQGSG